jgi:two-component system, cell cycle sensor histidine kinase and response regulator CckA
MNPTRHWSDRPLRRLGVTAMLTAVALSVGAVGVFVIRRVAQLNYVAEQVHRQSMLDLHRIGELQYEIQEARRTVLYALGTVDSNQQVVYADQSRAAEAAATRLTEQLLQHTLPAAAAATTREFQRRWRQYLNTRDEVLASILEGDTQAAIDLDLKTGVPEFNGVRESLLQLKEVLRRDADRRLEQVHQVTDRSLYQLGATLAVTLLVASGAVSMVLRYSRRAAEQDSEQRMREVVESVSEAMVVLDSSGVITLWNKHAAAQFGADARSAVGHQFRDVIPAFSSTALPAVIASAQAERKPANLTDLPLKIGAEQRFYEVRVFPWENGVTLFFNDTTERKQAEESRHALEKKLLESQKLESLGVLAGGIAHDFNNLLTAILGNTSLATLDLPAGSPVNAYVTNIETAAKEASSLCRQMLAYAGRGRFLVQTTDLPGVVEELKQLLRVSVPKTIDLRFETIGTVPPSTLDTTQIKQVLLNLVINAAEAIGEKPGVISVRTFLCKLNPGSAEEFVLFPEQTSKAGYACVEVSDSGCGMSRETQARIFDPFFTTKFTGRGLGLAAVLGIIRGHGGALKLVSAPGAGTTFSCYFPVDESAVPVVPSTPSHPPCDWSSSGDILVVDDEAHVRFVLTGMLKSLGFRTVTANDGEEGLQIFKERPQQFSAVVVDITMPRRDGHSTLAEMLRVRPDLPALIVSGFSEQEVSQRLGARARTAFLQKPFELADVREKLQALLS